MIRVQSRAIRSVDCDGWQFTVQFHSGQSYHHPGVAYDVFVAFRAAESMGAIQNRCVRGRFR